MARLMRYWHRHCLCGGSACLTVGRTGPGAWGRKERAGKAGGPATPCADWRGCIPEGSLQSLGTGAFRRKLAFEAGQDWLCRGTWEMAAVACNIASTWQRQTVPCTPVLSGLNRGGAGPVQTPDLMVPVSFPERMFLRLCAVACSLITYDRFSLTPSLTCHLYFLVAYLQGDYLRASCEQRTLGGHPRDKSPRARVQASCPRRASPRGSLTPLFHSYLGI